MDLSSFVYNMELGMEIEFSLNGHKYFIQPDYERANDADSWFVLYDCLDLTNIPLPILCVGTSDDIIDYIFDDGSSLRKNFYSFSIDFY